MNIRENRIRNLVPFAQIKRWSGEVIIYRNRKIALGIAPAQRDGILQVEGDAPLAGVKGKPEQAARISPQRMRDTYSGEANFRAKLAKGAPERAGRGPR
jgi:hypothetical protein